MPRRIAIALVAFAIGGCSEDPTDPRPRFSEPGTVWMTDLQRESDGSIFHVRVAGWDTAHTAVFTWRCVRMNGRVWHVAGIEDTTVPSFSSTDVQLEVEPDGMTFPADYLLGQPYARGEMAEPDVEPFMQNVLAGEPGFSLRYMGHRHRWGTAGLQEAMAKAQATCEAGI